MLSRGEAGTLWPLICIYVMGRIRRGEIVKSTANGFWSGLAVLDRVHGRRPVAHFNVGTVERWLEDRAGLAKSTQRTQWSYVSKFADWLVDEGKIKANPCRKLDAPRRPRGVPRKLDGDAIDKLIAVAPDARARAIIWLERGAALRRVEVHRANVEDWYRRDGIMRAVGKGGHERWVPITSSVARALDDYLTEYPATSGPLIRNYTTGERLGTSSLSHLMADWMYAAGVKHAPRDGVSGHSLRHTKATELADDVGDLRTVGQLLGHVHLSSTQVYAGHVPMPRLKEAMEALDAKTSPPLDEAVGT